MKVCPHRGVRRGKASSQVIQCEILKICRKQAGCVHTCLPGVMYLVSSSFQRETQGGRWFAGCVGVVVEQPHLSHGRHGFKSQVWHTVSLNSCLKWRSTPAIIVRNYCSKTKLTIDFEEVV